MRLPFALAALDWIASRDVHGARITLDLDGQRGWTCPAAGGYCVATELPLPGGFGSLASPLAVTLGEDSAPSRWLVRITLALAGQTELRDDSLSIASDVIWWVHRFDADEPAAQVEAQLRRQLLACALLASQGAHGHRAPPATSPHLCMDGISATRTSEAASAAAATRRLQSMRRD